MLSSMSLRSSSRSSEGASPRAQLPEVKWLATTYKTGLTPRGIFAHRARQAHLIGPQLTPRGQSPLHMRTTPRNAHQSPRVQREIKRVAEYQRKQKTKDELRCIIKITQDKRREEFRDLRAALGEIYNYTGRYLQRPGEKEAAAQLLRAGGLGAEFVKKFDQDAKWKWLQIRVRFAVGHLAL
ncbi:hypothetical protein DFH28DRAFT_928888 [Melampsora americana]|nr:hypothetical protein DFH28DRAFT_928888 [Melampsora americana]